MDIYHSIHTITLQRKIPLEEVSSYRSLLYGLSDRYGTGSYRKSENEYYFYMYAPQGVMIQPVPRLYENTGLQSARYPA